MSLSSLCQVELKPELGGKKPFYDRIAIDFCQVLERRFPELEKEISRPFAIVFGGDGTLLNAIGKAGYHGTFILIKDGGTLGHYAEFNSLDSLTEFDPSKSSVSLEEHGVLKLEYGGEKQLAVNEFLLSSPYSTLKFELRINGDLLSEYAASGICVSTPFGSTAYNHSLGGTLIFGSRGYEMNILAPIENRVYHSGVKSLYLDDDDRLSLVFSGATELSLAADMKTVALGDVRRFDIVKERACFGLLHLKNFSPCERLRKSFVFNSRKG